MNPEDVIKQYLSQQNGMLANANISNLNLIKQGGVPFVIPPSQKTQADMLQPITSRIPNWGVGNPIQPQGFNTSGLVHQLLGGSRSPDQSSFLQKYNSGNTNLSPQELAAGKGMSQKDMTMLMGVTQTPSDVNGIDTTMLAQDAVKGGGAMDSPILHSANPAEAAQEQIANSGQAINYTQGPTPYTGDVADIESKLKANYPQTNFTDVNKGFLTTDGKLVNVLDDKTHSFALENLGAPQAGIDGQDVVGDYMNQGGIRVAKQPGENYINVESYKQPTPEQLKSLSNIDPNTKIYADLTNKAANPQSFGPDFSGEWDNVKDFITKLKDFYGQDQGDEATSSIFRTGKPQYSQDIPDDMLARQRFNIPALNKISSGGSDREVFDLGDGNVLKIAKNARGLQQNMAEGEPSNIINVPQVVEQGKNYVVAQKADPPDAVTKSVVNALKKFQYERYPSDMVNKAASQFEEGSPAYNSIMDLGNYDFSPGDVSRISSWGTINGSPALIDAGSLNQGNIAEYATRRGINDPDYSDIYQQSRALKKQYGDTDPFTKGSIDLGTAIGGGGAMIGGGAYLGIKKLLDKKQNGTK